MSVQGVATAPVISTASAEAAIAAYRQAMAAAIADGQAKAQYLAEKSGATLGQVQSIGEGGGYIECPEGVEYEGAQPDFGSGGPVFEAGAVAPAARGSGSDRPQSRQTQHHHKRALRQEVRRGIVHPLHAGRAGLPAGLSHLGPEVGRALDARRSGRPRPPGA